MVPDGTIEYLLSEAAVFLLGFLLGYGMRAWISYRRHERTRDTRVGLRPQS